MSGGAHADSLTYLYARGQRRRPLKRKGAGEGPHRTLHNLKPFSFASAVYSCRSRQLSFCGGLVVGICPVSRLQNASICTGRTVRILSIVISHPFHVLINAVSIAERPCSAAPLFVQVCQKLIERKADLSAVDNYGKTALMVAAECNQKGTCELLMKVVPCVSCGGSPIWASDRSAFTARAQSCGRGAPDVVRALGLNVARKTEGARGWVRAAARGLLGTRQPPPLRLWTPHNTRAHNSWRLSTPAEQAVAPV